MSSGGALSWLRHTTIGTAQISHSAIQHKSSSWNHGVMRASSQRSQFASVSLRSATIEARPQFTDERGRALGSRTIEETSDQGGPDDHTIGFATHLDGLLGCR